MLVDALIKGSVAKITFQVTLNATMEKRSRKSKKNEEMID